MAKARSKRGSKKRARRAGGKSRETDSPDRTLPFVTNFNLSKYPLRTVLPRFKRKRKAALSRQRAVKPGLQTTNVTIGHYVSSLAALKLIDKRSGGLTAIGQQLAAAAKTEDRFNEVLAEHLMRDTTLSLVVRVLTYTAPHYHGSELKDQCIQTLETAFQIDVAGRRQHFSWIFGLLESCGLIDPKYRPVKKKIKKALGLQPDDYLASLASLSRAQRLTLSTLLRIPGDDGVLAEDLKKMIRDETGEIHDVGRGADGIGKDLERAGLVKLDGGKGHGARNTRLRVASDTLKEFLASPLARAHLFRPNREASHVLTHLKTLTQPLKRLLKKLDKAKKKDELLELVAAKMAFQLGCSDITIRSRETLPDVPAEGEKDVLATIERPFPYRVLIQCKAHKTAMGTSVLYRELSIALMSTGVRTILFFSTKGYTGATLKMQRACMRAFPHLTIALFDNDDLDAIASGATTAFKLVRKRLGELTHDRRVLEDSLSPAQLRTVAQALEDAGVGAALRQRVVDQLWGPVSEDLHFQLLED